MLKREEKREMLKDGRDKRRMKEFTAKKKALRNSCDSIDDYIKFLSSIQKVFVGRTTRRSTITKFNKL